MRRSEKSIRIRTMLRQRPMSTREISLATGCDVSGLSVTLRSMPDAYITGYEALDKPGRQAAIWAVITPPPNAKRPPKKRIQR